MAQSRRWSELRRSRIPQGWKQLRSIVAGEEYTMVNVFWHTLSDSAGRLRREGIPLLLLLRDLRCSTVLIVGGKPLTERFHSR